MESAQLAVGLAEDALWSAAGEERTAVSLDDGFSEEDFLEVVQANNGLVSLAYPYEVSDPLGVSQLSVVCSLPVPLEATQDEHSVNGPATPSSYGDERIHHFSRCSQDSN